MFNLMVEDIGSSMLGFQIQYQHARDQYYNPDNRSEHTSGPVQTHPENMTEEELTQEQLTSMSSNDKDIADAIDSLNFDFGLNYNWNQHPVVEGVSDTTSQHTVLQPLISHSYFNRSPGA